MPGKAVEQLFKNLRVEYQNVKRAMHISGCGTDGVPKLHRSTAIFNAFDSYYCLYFPHGGSSVPLLLITENSVQMLSRSADNVEEDAPVASVSTAPSADVVQLSSSTSVSVSASSSTSAPEGPSAASGPGTVASKLQSARFAGRRRRREPSRPTEMRQLIDLQMKQLQLERKRLRVESEKLECLRGIQSSLSIMCTALMPCLGVELVVGEE